MIRALLLGGITVTDKYQISTSIGGACLVILLLVVLL